LSLYLPKTLQSGRRRSRCLTPEPLARACYKVWMACHPSRLASPAAAAATLRRSMSAERVHGAGWQHLRSRQCSECLQSDVDDSYLGAKADIERLRAEQRLYAIHNHDLREFVLYPRCCWDLGRATVLICSEHGLWKGARGIQHWPTELLYQWPAQPRVCWRLPCSSAHAAGWNCAGTHGWAAGQSAALLLHCHSQTHVHHVLSSHAGQVMLNYHNSTYTPH
jgi:hypothetical protein